jgi:hypothetical protein
MGVCVWGGGGGWGVIPMNISCVAVPTRVSRGNETPLLSLSLLLPAHTRAPLHLAETHFPFVLLKKEREKKGGEAEHQPHEKKKKSKKHHRHHRFKEGDLQFS